MRHDYDVHAQLPRAIHRFFIRFERAAVMIRRIMRELTVSQLAALLRDAEIAHEDSQRSDDRADSDWAHWYAEYILRQLPEARWE